MEIRNNWRSLEKYSALGNTGRKEEAISHFEMLSIGMG